MQKLNRFILQYILPIGFFFMLTGMLFFSSMSAYHTQSYLFFIVPALLLSIFDRQMMLWVWSSLSFKLLLLFLSYVSLSLLWNDASLPDVKLIKKLLIIVFFIIGLVLLEKNHENRILKIMLISAAVFSAAAYFSFYEHYQLYMSPLYEEIGIIGLGNFSNPLLSSHVYGALSSFLMVYFFASERDRKRDALLALIFVGLIVFVILTKARTPLVALSCVFLYLIWMYRNKYVLYFVFCIVAAGLVFFTINYDMLVARGFSFRPQIWSIALEKSMANPLLGSGYGTKILIYIDKINIIFSDTHSIYMGIFYNMGLVGLILWLSFVVSLVLQGVKNKTSVLAQVGLGMFLYGMAAGLTEGTNFMTRPKEVWFLVWLPIALLLAAEYRQKKFTPLK